MLAIRQFQTENINGCLSVVFSFWTLTLDYIQHSLEAAGILYSRLDGSIPATKRSKAIRDFKENPHIQVILVSISCGGVGYGMNYINYY